VEHSNRGFAVTSITVIAFYSPVRAIAGTIKGSSLFLRQTKHGLPWNLLAKQREPIASPMKNEYRLRGVSFFALFLSLPVAAFSQPVIWTTSSLVRTGVSDPAGSGTQAVLSAARGEYESFQIAIQAPTGGL